MAMGLATNGNDLYDMQFSRRDQKYCPPVPVRSFDRVVKRPKL